MPNNSKNNILRIQQDISNLMKQGKSSEEIMQLLHIPLRSYRRYTAAIHKQDKEIWYSLVKYDLYTELLKLRSSLEETYSIALALAKNPDYKDILEALHVKDQARINIIQLLTEGSSLIRGMQLEQQYYEHKPANREILTVKQHHP